MGGSASKSQIEALLKTCKKRHFQECDRREIAIELAAILLSMAEEGITTTERAELEELAGMMEDLHGKDFITELTDQCFRSHDSNRVADQLLYVLERFGIPTYVSWIRRLGMRCVRYGGHWLATQSVPLIRHLLRKNTEKVIVPGEPPLLREYLENRRREGVRINLNHLGEAVLGEEEAKRRLQTYIEDLQRPEVGYISVKVSTIFSQINLLDWDETISAISHRLKQLYRAAMTHKFRNWEGKNISKFVNLDMEEYRDLSLTVEVFRLVLDEPEFHRFSAGIVLQAYLPDAFRIQQTLTAWAMRRVANGGAPIKIRLVKGANLAMERVESALHGWAQAPYLTKEEVDANFKRMVVFSSRPEHAKAVNIGIGSHNIFDIAYAMVLRAERNVEEHITFEMLEGMADHVRRVVQEGTGSILLYAPAAKKGEFQNAIAYLMRRLDENTAPQNFLRHIFTLKVGSQEWKRQANLFRKSCSLAGDVASCTYRNQDRSHKDFERTVETPFKNEPDTDFASFQNREWIGRHLNDGIASQEPIPAIINGQRYYASGEQDGAIGYDPSLPHAPLYSYRLVNEKEAEIALETAKSAEVSWEKTCLEDRIKILFRFSALLKEKRGELIVTMVADSGKTVSEADVELSEAIDFVEYYSRNAVEWYSLDRLELQSKGTGLIAPPWNFPCAIPIGGVVSALVMGNCVLLKPSQETVLVAWKFTELFYQAGVPPEVLQFVPCLDNPVGSFLVKDQRVNFVILTGGTSTAKLMMEMRPGIDLMAETGGKNAIIVTAMADRDLACRDIVRSSFGHAGQKCSACSLAILEAEVYDDPLFIRQLIDATESLAVGSSWDPKTFINPLVLPPEGKLLRGLVQLDPGEKWLLEPKRDVKNPRLWSPGIRFGVKKGSYSHFNEYFGPVLSVMRADDLDHAIELANATPYGLTSGLQSLDEREHQIWLGKIEAGNLYINRGITGAVVQRQPFGGTKASCFGPGAKAGGPNYLTQMVQVKEIGLPENQDALNSNFEQAAEWLTTTQLSNSDMTAWKASIGSYLYAWRNTFSKKEDPSLLLGQDNIFSYCPRKTLVLRLQEQDSLLDIMRIIAAASVCGTALEVSGSWKAIEQLDPITDLFSENTWLVEDEKSLFERIRSGKVSRIRLASPASDLIEKEASVGGVTLLQNSVVAEGRIELLNYVREVSLSYDYHRYGNLGVREKEQRASLVLPSRD